MLIGRSDQWTISPLPQVPLCTSTALAVPLSRVSSVRGGLGVEVFQAADNLASNRREIVAFVPLPDGQLAVEVQHVETTEEASNESV